MSESTSTLDRRPEADSTTKGEKQFAGNFAHRLYTGEFEFNFVARRKLWYSISAVLIVISLAALVFRGLNLGIEFKGGSVFTVPVSSSSSQTVDHVRDAVSDSKVANLTGSQATAVGANTVRVQVRSLSTDEVTQMRDALASAVNTTPDKVGYSLIGPSWGGQITMKAFQALIVFLVLVALMIWAFFREWRMAISALAGLIHDLIVTVGLYALIGFTVTPSTLIGVLTILGYSLYDNVVVFDKVRENTVDITKQNRTFSEAANVAINQVLVRSINTTIIGVLPVIALLIAGVGFLGGDGPLADLGLALLIGMVAGAYSSIFIATPLLTQLREREPDMKKHAAAVARRRAREAAEPTIKVSATTVSGSSSVSGVDSTTTVAAGGTDPDARPRPMREVGEGRVQPVRAPRSKRKK